MTTRPGPGFELQSVVHLVRPAGSRARNLESLRTWIAEATAAALFYHTVQAPLRQPHIAEPPPDDLSAWIRGAVRDRETAERVSFAIQSRAGAAADLRESLLEVLAGIPEKDRFARAAPPEAEFVFLTAESVRVPTGIVAIDPDALIEALAGAEPAVWFFHLIEEPWYAPGPPALARWAREHGDPTLARLLEEEARSGRGLDELRRRLIQRWRQGRVRSRVAAAARTTQDQRREAAHEAVVGLVRRITRGRVNEERP